MDFGIVLNEVYKLITEVWQAASQCGHDGVVEMGAVIDEYVDPVAVENVIQKFGRVDQPGHIRTVPVNCLQKHRAKVDCPYSVRYW